MARKVVVFDLDDTLYYEIDFLKSAYKDISLKISKMVSATPQTIHKQMLKSYYSGENVFEVIINTYNLSVNIEELLVIYRNHKPNIRLTEDRAKALNTLKSSGIIMGLITDGRSQQQRSKIDALKLENWISEVLISEEFGSEKPNINNFKHFENLFGKANYYYIGDNIKKDFIAPNKLGWTTICLKDNGQNIHTQNKEGLSKDYLAQYDISNFLEIIDIIIDT